MKKASLLFLTLCLFLAAQDSPTIRVSSRLVQVSVVVHRNNHPVANLTKQDFTLLDQGHPRDISLFSVNTSKAQVAKAAPLPPNTFSNYVDQQSNRPSTLTVILLDSVNTAATDQAYARQELAKFIRGMQPQDRVAIYVLGRSLKVLIDFTADSGEIQRTLARLSSVQALEVEAAKASSPDANTVNSPEGIPSTPTMEVAQMREDNFYTETSVEITAQALEAIAHHLARLPGRKNLVWISSGFPFTLNMEAFDPRLPRSTFGQQTKRAAHALNEANVAVYPVDASGLIGIQSFLGNSRGNRSTLDSYPETIDSMKHLAQLTGGRAFYNSMDIHGAVRSAIEDSSVTYTLGFYLSPENIDDKFHDIKVQVNRPGMEVRYRKGYFASKQEQQSDEQRNQELADALWSPLDATAIPLVMRLEPVDKPEPGLLRAYLAADLHSLTVEQQANGHWSGAVDVLIVQQDKTSRALDKTLQTLVLDLDPTEHDTVLKTGVPLGKFLRPKPGLATVRAIVMDRATGRIGSLIVPYSQVRETALKN